jgi:hypothetical protein
MGSMNDEMSLVGKLQGKRSPGLFAIDRRVWSLEEYDVKVWAGFN